MARIVISSWGYYGDVNPYLGLALARFLDDAEPPLVFTLGSSAVMAAGRFCEESVEATRRLGRRAVVLAGTERAAALASSLPPGMLAVDQAPHSLVIAAGGGGRAAVRYRDPRAGPAGGAADARGAVRRRPAGQRLAGDASRRGSHDSGAAVQRASRRTSASARVGRPRLHGTSPGCGCAGARGGRCRPSG